MKAVFSRQEFANVIAASTMDLTAAALLVVDMQNDFVRKDAPMEVPAARATLGAHRALMDAFRRHGKPVVYTRFLATPRPTLLWHWSPQCAPPVHACRKGRMRSYGDVQGTLDCAEVVDELRPAPGDLIIDKYGYGSFHETTLHTVLQSLSVRSLAVTGTVAQICVEETAREAFHRGYETTVVSDAVSSFDDELQAAMLKNFAMKFGWVASSEQLIARLG